MTPLFLKSLLNCATDLTVFLRCPLTKSMFFWDTAINPSEVFSQFKSLYTIAYEFKISANAAAFRALCQVEIYSVKALIDSVLLFSSMIPFNNDANVAPLIFKELRSNPI